MSDLNIAGICFNKYGAKVAERLNAVFKECGNDEDLSIEVSWFIRNAINPDRELFTSLEIKTNDWTEQRFKDTDVLIYICPSVQAVKHISGSITDHMSDPAVLVIDEKGEYCVPLLSGRRGEANDLGGLLERKADIKYINPLIDDPGSRFDIEEYALKTDMTISSSEAPLGIYVSPSYHTAYFDHTLWLIPRCLDVGIVCPPDKGYKEVRKAMVNALQSMSLYPEAVAKVATVKGCEGSPALQGIACEREIPILSYNEDELEKITKDGSAMNLAEAAALKASEGKLIINTATHDDVLIAVAMENIYIKF